MNSILRDPERRSRDSRSSRVDSGSVDMETPQSLSPRSPLDALDTLDGTLPAITRNSTSTTMAASVVAAGSLDSNSFNGGIAQSHPSTTNPSHAPLVNGHHHHSKSTPSSSSSTTSLPSHSGHSNNNNNNNHVIISSPSVHPVPSPVPVLHPKPLTISHSPSPATPVDGVMVGGSESTHSMISDRRVPIVPPRRCRTRSPTPNTSHGKLSFAISRLPNKRTSFSYSRGRLKHLRFVLYVKMDVIFKIDQPARTSCHNS